MSCVKSTNLKWSSASVGFLLLLLFSLHVECGKWGGSSRSSGGSGSRLSGGGSSRSSGGGSSRSSGGGGSRSSSGGGSSSWGASSGKSWGGRVSKSPLPHVVTYRPSSTRRPVLGPASTIRPVFHSASTSRPVKYPAPTSRPVSNPAPTKRPASSPSGGRAANLGSGGSSPGKLGFENVKPVFPASGGHKTGSGPLNIGIGKGSSGGSSAGNPPPIGFKGTGNTKPSAPLEHSVNSKHLESASPGSKPSAPIGPPTNVKPVGNPSPGASYHSDITNVNINNINTNTYYGGGGYGGGFGGYHSYSYTSREVGSDHLGFFLGNSLTKLTTPTFHYSAGAYSGYTPRYDHYEVHHYYHNRDSVPAQRTIEPNAIVGCMGDSGSICPQGTTSLCTNNGAILCVASATSTVPCTDIKGANCIHTVVPCVDGTKDCQVGEHKTVTIPCISKTQVPGNITYVNNTIITVNNTIINNIVNGTKLNSTMTSENSTMMTNGTVSSTTELPAMILMPFVTSEVPGNITYYVNNSMPVNNTNINNKFNGTTVNSTVTSKNSTVVTNVTASSTTEPMPFVTSKVPGNITYINSTMPVNNTIISSKFNGTTVTSENSTVVTNDTASSTTELPVSILMGNVTSDGAARSKRETHVNEFCVAILAVPAERKPSEQEQLVDHSADIFSKFLVRALGIN